MGTSINQVAARAGVSPATVSRVMNNTAVRIAPRTRERVERAAREMEYHPSAAARALARRQTDTLGVVLPPSDESPLRSPFFSALLDGVLEAATERHLNIMVFTSQTGHEAQRNRSMAQMRDGRCDGLLVFYQPPDDDILPALLDARVPCALICDWREDPRLPCADVENVTAARSIAEHLLGLGHRRIALLSSVSDSDFSRERIRGYHEALTAWGVPAAEPTPLVANLMPWDVPSVFAHVAALMALPAGERPTALMCLEDAIAALCMAALGQMGLRVPEDISVTGFNDDHDALRQHPALTTVRQPYVELGRNATDLLLARIAAGPDAPVGKIRLDTELVVRGSTAAPTGERGTR